MRYSRSVSLMGIFLTLSFPHLAFAQSLDHNNRPKNKNVTSASPWDIELAFSMKTFTYGERPVISPDGKFVAYSVLTPPTKSVSSDYPIQPRILPNGTPASKVGSSVFVVDLVSRKEKKVGHGKGNSWRPSWSPDGSLLAFYADTAGYPQLWVYNTRTGATTRLTDVRIKAKLWLGEEAFWTSDGQEVFVGINLDEKDNLAAAVKEQPPAETAMVRVLKTGQEIDDRSTVSELDDRNQFFLKENNATLAKINLRTGAVKVRVNADAVPRPSYLRLSPSRKWISYLSVYQSKDMAASQLYFDLVVLPSDDGPTQILASDLEVPQRDYYRGTYRWHPSQDQLVFVKDRRLWLVDFTRGSKLVTRQIAESIGQVLADPLLFTSDGKFVVVRLQGSDTLAVVPVAGGNPKLISVGKEFQYQDIIRSSETTLWSAREGHIALQMTKAGNEGFVLFLNLRDGKTEIAHKYLSRSEFIQTTPDQRSILASIEDPQTPQNLYVIDGDTFKKRQITDIEPRLKDVRFGDIETFETEVVRYDGARTKVKTGVLLPPGSKRGEKLPGISFIYAGSNLSQYVTRYGGGRPATIPAQILVTRGYAVLLLDVALSPTGQSGNPIHDMADVILPQVFQAASLGYIDIERVGVIGQSYGGYSTASITTETSVFKAAVAISGLYDLIGRYGIIRHDGISPQVSWSETGQGRMGTHPWADLQRYVRNSPYLQADKIKTPLLLLHGSNDYVCAVEEPEKMFTALKRLAKTAQLAVYNGEGHVVYEWSLVNAVDATRRILDFLDRYLVSQSKQAGTSEKR